MATKLYTASEVLKLLPKGWRQLRIKEAVDSDNVPVFRLRAKNYFFLYYGFHGPKEQHRWLIGVTDHFGQTLFSECIWGRPLQSLYKGLKNYQHESNEVKDRMQKRATEAFWMAESIKRAMKG